MREYNCNVVIIIWLIWIALRCPRKVSRFNNSLTYSLLFTECHFFLPWALGAKGYCRHFMHPDGVGGSVKFLVVGTIGHEERPTKGSALDGAVFDISQILAYLVHNMSRSQLYLGFGHFG